ncbi:hypothetical protein BGS_1090 [Beggiatoa sp. SS]|nr:hypothetical protein BGS_1090 [Beggiatoa sp. SS]
MMLERWQKIPDAPDYHKDINQIEKRCLLFNLVPEQVNP